MTSHSYAGTSNFTRENVVVRPMTPSDVPRTVEMHLSAFPGFFLTFLGPRFLRLFYAEAVDLGQITLVACLGDSLVGFVMGSVKPGAFFSTLLRRRALRFALAALPGVARRPSAAMRIARALVKPAEATKSEGTATLLSLGIARHIQGQGAGKALVTAFLREATLRGSIKVDLTTDKLDNERTNAFYQKLGFHVAREIVTPHRRILNEYEIALPTR